VCRFHIAAGAKLRPRYGAIYKLSRAVAKPVSINLRKLVLSPTGSINLGFILREDLVLCSSYLPLGVPNWVPNKHYQAIFLALLLERKRISARGVSRFQSFTLLLFCFTLFLLSSFYKKIQKNSSFIVIIFACLLLVLLEWVLLRTPSCVILLAPITMILFKLLLRHLVLRQIFMRLNLLC
jgi:hypothetical protein